MSNFNKLFLFIFPLITLIRICQSNNNYKNQAEIQSSNSADNYQNKHRFLAATKQPIRITVDFSFLAALNQDKQDYIKELFQVAKKFFNDLLKVDPFTQNLIFPSNISTCGGEITVASADQTTGIANSDIHFYVSFINNPAEDYFAYSAACVHMDSGLQRPIFARIIYNEHYMTYTTGDTYRFSKDLQTTIHEMLHSFGFSTTMFQFYKDSSGNAYPATLYQTTFQIMGQDYVFLQTPKVQEAARAYFSCPTLEGMPLENEEISGSTNVHWEKVSIYNDIMGASKIFQKSLFTIFDVALLKDTGWYEVNEALAEDISWGKGKGCDFIYKACQEPSFTEFCSGGDSCDYTQMIGGSCASDSFSSGCKIIQPNSDKQCLDSKITPLSAQLHHQYRWDSRCIISDLYDDTTITSSSNLSCYTTKCDSGNTQITITIGSQSIICDQSNNSKTILNFTGTLTCPSDISLFCKNQQRCQDFCSQKGYCNKNKCFCLENYFKYEETCVATCPNGYIADAQNVCVVVNCLENESQFNCKTCNNNECTTCSDKFYLDSSKLCQACGTDCKVCTDNSICTQCIPGKVLQENVCQSTCNDGYYEDSSQVCQKCLANCNKCSTQTTCDSCISNYYLYQNNQECVATCPTNTFIDNTKCSDCHINCDGCNGSNNTDCTNCLSNKFLYQGACVDSCTQTQYTVTITNGKECKDCQSGCLQCTESNQCTNCGTLKLQNGVCQQSCNQSYYPDSSNVCQQCSTGCLQCTQLSQCIDCGQLKIQGGICKSQCDQGYYPDSSNNCIQCGNGCNTCTSSTNCTQCEANKYNQSGKCQSDCDEGYYADFAKICQPCHTSCQSCLGSGSNQCQACKQPLKYYKMSCYQACPSNTYSGTYICYDCDLSCNECTSSTSSDCKQCASGYVLVQGACKKFVCGTNQYLDTSVGICKNCQSNCEKCGSYSICDLCQSAFYNQNGICKTQCDIGFYATSNKICLQCGSNCTTCNSSECTKCYSGYYVQSGVCQTSCNQDNFPNSLGICQSCGSNCQICASLSSCQLCKTGFVNQSGICQLTCNKKYFPVGGNYCQICGSNCDYCSNEQICTTCSPGFVKQNNLCLSQCDSNYYLDLSGVCQICHSSCATCLGSADSQCKTCFNGQKLYQSKCYNACPTNTYAKPDNLTCGVCNISCDGCNGPTDSDCLDCALSYVRLDSSCKDKCNDNQYVQNRVCKNCDLYCNKCTGPMQCTQCQLGYVLQNGICQVSCSEGFYNSGGICKQCSPNCKTCDGSLTTECSSCLGTYILYKNTCLPICDNNRYLSDDNTECYDCNPVCDGCYKGNTPDKCNGCVSSHKMQGGVCISKCALTQYFDGTACTSCSSGCQECVSNSQCVKCQSGLMLQNGKCQSYCDPGFVSDSNGNCTQCYSRCKTCTGPLRNQCVSCNSTYKLFEGQCLDECPAKTYNSSNNCLKCHISCLSCISSNNYDCQTCDPSYYRNGQMCTTTCDTNQYVTSFRECKDCEVGCSYCTSSTLCQECSPGYSLKSGKCQQSSTNNQTRNKNCHFTCKTCVGNEYNQCTSCISTRYLSIYYTSSLTGECVCMPETTDIFEPYCTDSRSAEQQQQTQIASTSISTSVSFLASALSYQSPLFLQVMDFQQSIGALTYVNKKNAMQYDDTTVSMRKLNLNYLIPSPFSDVSTLSSSIYNKRALSTIKFSGFQNKIAQMHGSDSFLVNSFIIFLFNIIVVIIMIISKLTTSSTQIHDVNNLQYKITSYIKLTFPTLFLMITISELSICIFLQFVQYSISFSEHKVAGLVLAIFSLLYIFIFIGYLFYIAYDYQQIIKSNDYLYVQQFLSLLKTQTYLQRAHFGLLMVKKVIQSIFIVTLYSQPIACISILFSMEVLFCIYLAVQQPFKERHTNIITIISNIGLTIIYLIFLINTAGDQTDGSLQSGCVLALVIITNIILFSYSFYMIYLIFISVRNLMYKQNTVLQETTQNLQQTTQQHMFNQQHVQLTTTQQNLPTIYQNEEQLYNMMAKLNQTPRYQNKGIDSSNIQHQQYVQNMQSYYKQQNLVTAFSNGNQKQNKDLYDIRKNKKNSPIRMIQNHQDSNINNANTYQLSNPFLQRNNQDQL